jgi:competence protein ComEA
MGAVLAPSAGTAHGGLAGRSVLALCALAIALAMLSADSGALAANDAGRAGAASSRVNVNTASIDELQVLPGIGESRARAIVERRQSQGAFQSVEQLTEIRGIGPAMVERLRPLVSVSGSGRSGSARGHATTP